jgi:hypothetical protein
LEPLDDQHIYQSRGLKLTDKKRSSRLLTVSYLIHQRE